MSPAVLPRITLQPRALPENFVPTQAARHSLSPGCPHSWHSYLYSFSCLPGADSLGSTGGPYHWAGEPWLSRESKRYHFVCQSTTGAPGDNALR